MRPGTNIDIMYRTSGWRREPQSANQLRAQDRKVRSEELDHEREVDKGVRGMPWLHEAMKGAISCEKPRVDANSQ